MSKRTDIQHLKDSVAAIKTTLEGEVSPYGNRYSWGLTHKLEELCGTFDRQIWKVETAGPGWQSKVSRLTAIEESIEQLNQRLDVLELSKRDQRRYRDFRRDVFDTDGQRVPGMDHKNAMKAVKV